MNLISDFLPVTEFTSYEQLMRDFKVNVKPDFNFAFDVVDKYAELEPEKLALVWRNDRGEEKFINFKEVSTESNRIANMLFSKGVRKGDHVLIMLMSRYEYWFTVIACHKLGAVAIPATSQLTSKDIAYRCNYANVKCIISVNTSSVTGYVKNALPDCKSVKHAFTVGGADGFEDFHKEYSRFDGDKLDFEHKNTASEPMLAYFTSGTTGMPKMVTHNYAYAAAHIATAYLWHCCRDGGLHFTAADTGWAKASWGKIYGQWICGSANFIYDYYGKYTPLDVLPLLEKYKVTTFCAPPTMYRFLIKEDLSKYDLSSIEHYCTAGEPLNPVVYEQIKSKIGKSIYEGYGQTETVLALGTFPCMEPRPASMGKPCPLYAIELLDDNGKPVPDGVEGEICIKYNPEQIGLFMGYNTFEKMRSVWSDGYYHTGDVATRDSDGYFWFVGRDDDIIKSSGYRIGPFEVESALLEHPSVMECAITAVPDDVRGQIIKATVVLARNFFPSDELIKELQDHVKHTTAPYKYPRVIEFVDRLPKTISEKIRRVEIRENDKKN